MAVLIDSVEKLSIAQKYGINIGDTLVAINGNPINDVLDYRFYMTDKKLELDIISKGVSKSISVIKPTYKDLGLDFDSYLMDNQKSCKNKCIFCFVDQLPKGMRNTVYFKDDDSRMSFLFGNYITLTNMTDYDIDRIIKMKISPINISVHTMNPDLRVFMMKNKNAGQVLKYIKILADAGIVINTQLVLCPGVNDGDELLFSLGELGKLYPSVQSVAVVPVGVTKFRDGLFDMKLYDKVTAAEVVDIIDRFGDQFAKTSGGDRLVMAADEFYIKAGRDIPPYENYGDFSQLENGVGMISLFTEQFENALENHDGKAVGNVTVATGVDAKPFLQKLVDQFTEKNPRTKISVVGIENKFFGDTITVAGLITGSDLISALSGKLNSNTLLIPSVMLRFEQDLFLDDLSLNQVENELGVDLVVVDNDGEKFLHALDRR